MCNGRAELEGRHRDGGANLASGLVQQRDE